jgi:hypothetical protein
VTEAIEKTAYQRLKRAQAKFVDLVVQGYNGTEAVRKLYPHYLRPDVKAAKWRRLELVRQAIEERSAEAMEDAGITNAQILLDIATLARVSMKALVWCEGEKLPEGVKVGQAKKLHELDDVTARCIQSIEYTDRGDLKVRFPDRLAAKKLLGQYKRLFTETHEINLGEKTLEQLAAASWGRQE